MATALVFIHGRSAHLPGPVRGDADRVAAHVAAMRRRWRAGLAKGLVLARQAPVPDHQIVFPFYGNRLADLVEAAARAGRPTPNLETLEERPTLEDEMVLEAAEQLGFDAERELSYLDPAMAEALEAQEGAEVAVIGGLLRSAVVRAALQFLARKTGIPAWVIEEFLDDVTFYLEDRPTREAVLEIVLADVRRAQQDFDDVVVVGHSLGTVVAYDVLQRLGAGAPVRLFVTAGSPLGFPVVQRNLLGGTGAEQPPVPPVQPRAGGPHWVNAYDVRDVVALVHPLATRFAGGAGRIADEITNNQTDPHDIEDYLSDPDVARPIGLAVERA